MRELAILLVCGLGGGCVYGAGAAIGYGTKRGFYAGVSGTAGISAGAGTIEFGGTSHGAVTQLRLEAEANRGKMTAWSVDDGGFYPAARAGFGGAYHTAEHEWSMAALIGPELLYVRNNDYCSGAPFIYGGIEYRYVGGESQLVLAPKYEVVSDICLR